MDNYKEIPAVDLEKNSFVMLGKEWALLSAGNKESANTMTISWGGLGVIWHKPVAYVLSRPQRHTKKFIDENETFSITFFDEKYKKTLSYLGNVSGKDEDKISKSNLTLKMYEETPYFEEATCVLICKKSYNQDFTLDSYVDKSLAEKYYPLGDHPTMYIGEILHVFIK